MSSRRRIAALTKLGIENLQRGHFKSAILSLRHAASCMKTNFNSFHGDDQVPSAEYIRAVLPLLHAPLTDIGNLSELSLHNTFDVYIFVFALPQRPSELQEFSHEVALMVFYHLGLAHHLVGLSNTSESQDHLKAALSYYKIALALFQSEDNARFHTWFSFTLGLLNNIGHIFCHFCQFEEACFCGSQIEHLLGSTDAPLLEAEEKFFATRVYSSSNLAVAPCA